MVERGTGAAHGRMIRKRRIHRPLIGWVSACAIRPAQSSTIACETIVKRSVFRSARRKFGSRHTSAKLPSPTHSPPSVPPTASVRLRYIASSSGPPTSTMMKTTAGAISAVARNRRLSRRFRRRRRVPLAATVVTAGGSYDRFGLRRNVAQIALEQLTKVYPDGTKAVTSLDLEIEDGELVVFVGPSGCGKTTALRMIAGLEEITEGTVRIGDEVVNDLPPKDRDIAMIFQNYALYPHMSAYDNMAFGLKLRKVPG